MVMTESLKKPWTFYSKHSLVSEYLHLVKSALIYLSLPAKCVIMRNGYYGK